MSQMAFLIQQATFNAQRLTRPFVLTLYGEPEKARKASLTVEHPFSPGQAGSLEVLGARDGVLWRITLPQVRISEAAAVGCEFDLLAPARMQAVGPLADSGLAAGPQAGSPAEREPRRV